MNFKKTFLLLPLLLWGSLVQLNQDVYCQTDSFKYFKNYTPADYDHHPQNWMITRDSRGIIYVGNQAGLLEFDGVSWRIITVTNQSVLSMAIDETDTVYIGGKNEIGFLKPDAAGTLKYVSLLDHLADNNRDIANVWETYSTAEGIYFRTSKYLLRWNSTSGAIKVWEPTHSFNISFACGGKLYIHDRKIGLMQMVKDSLQLLPGGESFMEKRIFILVPYDDRKLLIGTRSEGFFIYDGKAAKPFPTEADDYLKEKQLYHGIRLSSSAAGPGDFALATLRGGLVIIDSRGKVKQIFDKSWGLQDDNVKHVFRDSQGNLWLALNEGIAKIEYASPFSIYDDRSDLSGIVLSIVRHGPQKDLYVGTTSGLYYFVSPSKFRAVPGVSGNCWSLISINESLLTATSDGVFQVSNKIKSRIIEAPSHVLLRSKSQPKRIWVGTQEGLASLYREKNQWTAEYTFEDITQSIRTIVEDKKGNLWLGTLTQGVFKVDFPGTPGINNPVVSRYHTSHGLPAEEVNVFMAAGHVMFATVKGIFRFDEKNNIFVPDPTLGTEFADGSRNVFRIAEDRNKNIWFHSRSRNFQAILKPDGLYDIYSKPFLRIPDVSVNTIYPDPDGTAIWFAGNAGLIRYDKTVKKNYRRDFPALIRRVQRINDKSLVFDGFKEKTSGVSFPVFDYKDRNLRFEFAAPFFEEESANQYQVFLDGYDDDWSDWTSETQKDYTNLDSGFYTFRVRARNVYEHLGKEATFQFKVLPPWYQTWWAFLFYAFGILFLVYVVVRWRSWKLEKEKQHLEQIVKVRTKEIEEKNQQLEEQSEQLKEMDRIKSRFFANISHEFRTPLTLIMGPLEQILASPPTKEELEKRARLMLRNSQRLLNLINQLLELSKFESGKMKLQASRQNIVTFLKGIVASFELIAAEHELNLTFEPEVEEIPLYFDPEKLEKVICNLLSNAVKFTPAGGKITVSTKQVAGKGERKHKPFPSGYVELTAADTGIGIPEERLANIFDRFYQAESTDVHEHNQKGSGIGLALAKELVELHHGIIDVRSRKADESGTEFIVCLPMGNEHLAPGEIVDLSEIAADRPKPCKTPDAEKDGEKIEKEKEEDIEVETETETQPGIEEKNIILVVDDSADIRDYIRGSLELFYRVEEASDGREGIEKAKEIIPDLIVCDIMMPEVDGYELCNVLKKDVETCHIPIVVLTAKASEESVIRGLATGADDYITKPFNTRILTARIKNLIDLRRQLQLKRIRQMTLQPDEISVTSIDETFYKELQGIIEKNLSNSEFSVEQMCKKLYMGRTSLYRKILALTGETPTGFIRSYRLKRAAQLLKANFGNVTEVAFEVGFSSTAYFTKCFKEKFHQIPSNFQDSD